MNNVKISVCIPAFNRASQLSPLLDSILSQDYNCFDVVIAEDNSPEREAIRLIANDYSERHSGSINYFENSSNIGYDSNLRKLFELAKGEYVLFMGNDDLMCPGALAKVADAVGRHSNVGVVLRSYAAFEGKPDNIVQTFRYFDRELFFPAGPKTISALYRRSVVIPGMVIHRKSALKFSTNRFDGKLLYQLYLIANILVEKNAVFLPDITVLYRNDGTPDFGNSISEVGKFKPKEQTPESSLFFVQGMLDIARYVGQERGVAIYKPILKDIANYSYPLLSIQACQPFSVFMKYSWGLAKMGFGYYKLFWVYWLAILLLGVKRLNRLIGWIKVRLGHTPTIGKVYKGSST